MVPVRLQLQNFLSYGENVPPLDFTAFSVACLSGPNGHGKSALIDAVTWALWGEARKERGAARPHAGLLRMGAVEMWVDLEFDHEGERYRVLRRWARSGASGSLELEFSVRDPASGELRGLTSTNVTQTQQRINALLRMDYTTFTNSACLLQGRADAFTQRSPAERKQILTDVLGLSRYDDLNARAKARRRAAEQERVRLEDAVATLTRDLADADAVAEQLDATARRLAELQQAAGAREGRLGELRESLAEDHRRRERVELLEQRRQETAAASEDAAHQIAARERTVAGLEAVLAKRGEVHQKALRLAQIEAQRDEMERALRRRAELTSRRHRLQGEIQRAQTELAGERARLADRTERLEQQRASWRDLLAAAERIRKRYDAYREAVARLERLGHDAGRHRRLQERLDSVERRLNSQRATLEAEARQLDQRAAELRRIGSHEPQRRAALGEAQAALEEVVEVEARLGHVDRTLAALQTRFEMLRDGDGQSEQQMAELRRYEEILAANEGECPVCRQPLDDRHRAEVEAEYSRRRAEMEARRQKLREEAREVKRERATLEKSREGLVAKRTQLPERQRELARAERSLQEALDARAEAAKLDEQVKRLRQELAADEFGGEDREEARRLRRELAELGYDPERHELLTRQTAEERGIEAEHVRLEEAERVSAQVDQELPPLRLELAAIERQLNEQAFAAESRAELRHVEAELATLTVDEAQLEALDEERRALAEVPREQQRIEDAEKRLPEEQSALAAQRRRSDELARRLREVERERDEVAAKLLDREAATRELTALEDEQATAARELAAAHQRHGELQAARERHQRQRVELDESSRQVEVARREQTLYDHLATAFGRDGIPALIIENAVPEIETYANELLQRLTGHRMSVGIRLQRPLQAGGERETLDIDISDELGTRSYELYSGGESFRVNFALRLALSRLLARRAGAPLRTLFIDEGFGTQDEEGLDQLVEAIHSVSDEFDLMLVVTHLAPLKERFATWIEVSKEPGLGSRFAVRGAPGDAA